MALTHPRFKYCYDVQITPQDGIFLLHEGGHSLVTGRLYSRLAPLIDGKRTPEEIVGLLDGQVEAAQVYYGLSQLDKRGFLAEADADTAEDPSASAYWELTRQDAATVRRELGRARVTLTALDERAKEPMRAALGELGIDVVAEGGFRIVLVDDYLNPLLDTINREQLAAGAPWMLIKAIGVEPWLGPVFRPEETGCWECLAQRLRGNRAVEMFLLDRHGGERPPSTSRSALPPTVHASVSLAAVEVARILLDDRSAKPLDGAVLSINTYSLETARHWLVRRPQCTVCGDPERWSAPRPIRLESRPVQFTADGGHRAMPPEETYERLKGHVSPITGAVTSLIRGDTGRNPVMHSYVAGHNFAQNYGDIHSLRRTLRTMAGGKGATDIQAKVSAIGEAIERYAGVFRGDEPRVRARFHELGDQAIDPRTLLHYSDAQFAGRVDFHKDKKLYHAVPAPFREEMEMEWTPVWSLTEERFKYIPTQHCYYNYHQVTRLGLDDLISLADSNGCAAGNTIEEAILQGFMEVVERDCVAMFWYNRIQRPEVDVVSFGIDYIARVQEYLARTNRALRVLDLTNDLGVPAFCGVVWRTDRLEGQAQEIVVGFGAHFDPALALMRAITECNQFLSSFEHFGDTDTRYAGFDPLAATWWQTATLDNQPYLVPHPDLPVRRASDYPPHASADLREDVEECVRVARAQGLEMLVLDQSRPDVDLNVVKVFVPGARHFWQRMGPGRLYDVPVKLGWLDKPRTEEEMNPFPVFF